MLTRMLLNTDINANANYANAPISEVSFAGVFPIFGSLLRWVMIRGMKHQVYPVIVKRG